MAKIIVTGDKNWVFPFQKPKGSKPSPYLYQVALDHEIPPGMLFHDCLVSIAQAHQQHAEGNTYSCYGTWIGRGIVWLIYPLETPNDVDRLLDDEIALCSMLGQEAGKKRYEEYKSTLISEIPHLLEYMPQYSNPNTKDEETPLEYIYYRVFDLSDSYDKEIFDGISNKIIEAHRAHPNGLNWVTYKEANSNRLHLYCPMRRFGAMDDWPTLHETLNAHYQNSEEADAIRTAFYASFRNHHTQIMTFVPSCDNSGSEFVE